MKDIFRYALYTVVAILSVLLARAWEVQFPAVAGKAVPQQAVENSRGFVPAQFQQQASKSVKEKTTKQIQENTKAPASHSQQRVWVKTDLQEVAIDANSGQVVEVKLLKFPVSLEKKNEPVTLLNSQRNRTYLAQSGLVSNSGYHAVEFHAERNRYTLQSNQQQLKVSLTGTTDSGLVVKKTFVFERNKYAIQMNTQITNRSRKTWVGNTYVQLYRQPVENEEGGLFGMHYFNGASTSSPETPYEKIKYEDMQKRDLNRSSKGGWVAMQQHYFLSAWVPGAANQKNHFYTHHNAAKNTDAAGYVIGFVQPQMQIAPKATASASATLYVGPESNERLSALAPGLDHTIDYGFLWPISITIQWVMSEIVDFIPNWGVAIILATILIKILFYGFSSKSFISMAKMKELQPRIKALKERFGDDRMGLQKATMELYKEKKVNPLGGCLPMLIQIPVFIALYWVITQSVDFRQAPFAFWINDLSVKDPYYVLPLLMMLTMLLQQKLSPSSADPSQAKAMMIMPIVFAFLFRNFPAGLVLYWSVNNLVQALQQWYVMNRYQSGKYKQTRKKGNQKSKR